MLKIILRLVYLLLYTGLIHWINDWHTTRLFRRSLTLSTFVVGGLTGPPPPPASPSLLLFLLFACAYVRILI